MHLPSSADNRLKPSNLGVTIKPEMASTSDAQLAGSREPHSAESLKQPAQTHSRTYQACVRIFPVYPPMLPPDNYSSHAVAESEDVEGYADDIDDEFVARNSRRPTTYTMASPDTQAFTGRPMRRSTDPDTSPTSSTLEAYPRHESRNSGASVPYYVDNKATPPSAGLSQELANETAAALFKAPISTPGDALHLLLEASGRSETFQQQSNGDGEHQQITASPELQSTGYPRFTRPGRPASVRYQKEIIDPAIANSGSQYLPDAPDVAAALRTWSRLRFVRAGWFTAREAMSYID
ncbi:MAG: hypothetical protein Q9218_002265 [Villophora microphyllina]